MSENRIETISVSQFVKEYKEIANEGQKKIYIKKHIIRTYCPILEKINMLKIMNDKSVVDNECEKYIDMNVSKLNSVMTVLILYTDIRTDKDGNGIPKTWECYDLLQSTELISKIIEFIGNDIDELMRVQKEVIDTWYMKNTSAKAYITDLVNKSVDRFGVVAGAGMKELSEALDDENKMKKFYSIFEKFLKVMKK